MTDLNFTDPLDFRALREMVEGTSAETGEAFFDKLVCHMARALGTRCAWVTEWLPETSRLRALSFWAGDRLLGNYEYPVAGTACEVVVTEKRRVLIPNRVLDLYTTDESLKPLGPVSYLGIPLYDTDRTILGHLAILHDQPMQEDPLILAIFDIFANRAASELRRIRRDRDLMEREQKLTRLIESAMDAIIEIDADFTVTRVNQAAADLFGGAPGSLLNRPFTDRLTSEAHGKLIYLTKQLTASTDSRPSLWIPDGLVARRANGDYFPAEATLSLWELNGRRYFTLILRDIEQRLNAEERIRSLVGEADYLRSTLDELQGFEELIGESEALRRVQEDVGRVAPGNTTVLITGETGTGKELIARAIHRHSPRADRPLIRVNCAAIAPNLQESEFFGHEKGAFTGAVQRREGRFKLADRGTIFLDEVGEMPLDLQAKLLRVVQEGEFEPVGSSVTEHVDVRVVAATNRDLAQMVELGSFRRDLLYRLNIFPIHIPPLRERGSDVLLLANQFAAGFARQRGNAEPILTARHRAMLLNYSWPGNVRELQNVIERALITSSDGRTLNLERALPEEGKRSSVPDNRQRTASSAGDGILTAKDLQDLERASIVQALTMAKWKVSGPGGAAEILGMIPSTLASRIKTLGIKKPATE
ncbi:MAG: sigma 54-interacting transcriptional regulator [Candidatus Zixiibacteriota bacterium]